MTESMRNECATIRRERLTERSAVAMLAALLSGNVAIAIASLMHF